MSERLFKMSLAIKNRADTEDVEWLRGTCHQLLEMALVLDRREPTGNYTALVFSGREWFEVASGSKDYCIGYADAYTTREGGPADKVVTVGTFIVWPEDRWGDYTE